jgi:hypothetical protein
LGVLLQHYSAAGKVDAQLGSCIHAAIAAAVTAALQRGR